MLTKVQRNAIQGEETSKPAQPFGCLGLDSEKSSSRINLPSITYRSVKPVARGKPQWLFLLSPFEYLVASTPFIASRAAVG
jgi:hypothetical protein